MAGLRILAAMTWLATWPAAAEAVDWSRIDRSIRKEPVYTSARPQYALLVFGPEAKVRVWVVLDGDVLYVDRNGNGDLTEAGERIPLDENDRSLAEPPNLLVKRHVWRTSEERPDIEVIRTLAVWDRSKELGTTAGEPLFGCVPEVHWFHVEHYVPKDDPSEPARSAVRRKWLFRVALASSTGGEQDTRTAFADRATDAPVFHFLGPSQLTWESRESLELRRGENSVLCVSFRTPGLNARVRTYEGIPASAFPVAKIEFPASRPGGTPIVRRVELKEPGG